jgi:hypothetical protein
VNSFFTGFTYWLYPLGDKMVTLLTLNKRESDFF